MKQPLTVAERDFAEHNHRLLYALMHRKGISLDDYGEAAELYLRAVRSWFSRPDLRARYTFATVLNTILSTGFARIHKKRSQQAAFIAVYLDEPFDNNGCYADVIPAESPGPEDMLTDLTSRIEQVLSASERKVFRLLLDGLSQSEIAPRCGVSRPCISHQVAAIRRKTLKLI